MSVRAAQPEYFNEFLPESGQVGVRIDPDAIVERVFPKPRPFDPVGWAEEHGIELWSKQREFIQSIADHKFTAVRSCHEVGKSFGVCIVILAWVDTYGRDAFALWSAPTYPQVDSIIGRELRDMVKMLGLDHIEVLESNEIKYHGDMRGYGRKPADHNKQGFSGIHARYPLVILDEGGAMPKTLFDGANTVVGNQNGRVATIGNPDNPVAHFKKLFGPGSKWNQVKIDAWHSPNFTKEGIADCPLVKQRMRDLGIKPSTEKVSDRLREVLLHPETAEEWLEEYGPNSAYVSSKLDANFPTSAENAVYPFEVIDQASAEVTKMARPRCLTLDVASSGSDEAVALCIRADGSVTEEFSEPKSDLMKLADRTAAWWRANRQAVVVVDANGLGEGVFSRLKQLGVRVRGFYGQQAPRDRKTYVNARAEAAFETARAMRNNYIKIDIHDDVLRGELPNVIWEYGDKNKFKLMSKEDMAARGIASPNRADALSMGVWELRLGVVRSGRTGFVNNKDRPVTVHGGYAT
jgi:hypothetical protein